MLEMPALWRPVLEFWFGDSLESGWPQQPRNGLWFRADAAVDEHIRLQFGAMVEAALQQEWVDWEAKPLSRLALVILLDQFTRNIWRGKPQAFSGDHRAVTLVMEGLARGMDRQLPWIGRVFFYMPLMHAEDLDLQDECIAAFTQLHNEMPEALRDQVAGNIRFAEEHREVIQRFGRFPHRNAVLGRDTTEEEAAFLEHASRYGQ